MMSAAAHIPFDDSLKHILLNIKQCKDVPYSALQITYSGDNRGLLVSATVPFNTSLTRLFSETKALANPSHPCILLMRIDSHSNSSKWILIPWIPEGTSLEEIKNYALARQQIGVFVSNSNLLSEFYITNREQLNYYYFNLVTNNDCAREKGYTPLEKRLHELELLRNTAQPKDAPPIIELKLSTSLVDALKSMRAKAINVIRIKVEDENSMAVAEASSLIKLSQMQNFLKTDEPRYYFVSDNNKAALFLFSPEGAKKTWLLLYTACKCAMIGLLNSEGYNVWKSVDSNYAADFNESIFQGEFDTQGELLTKVHPKPLPPKNRYSKSLLSSRQNDAESSDI